MGIAEIALSDIIPALVDLAVQGVKALAEAKKAERAKLVRLYREVHANRFLLAKSGLLKAKKPAIGDSAVQSNIRKLSNRELSPLYKVNRRKIMFPDAKRNVERRRQQYAINYIITKIDELKTLAKLERNGDAPAVRLAVRLRTLDKHLATMEKVLKNA